MRVNDGKLAQRDSSRLHSIRGPTSRLLTLLHCDAM
jgi:hypothetical protein